MAAPSQTAKDAKETPQSVAAPLSYVQIDGLVILKVIKHCQDNLPDIVTGQLLGLDFGDTLEVTNSFPFPRTGEDEESDDSAAVEYQVEMMRCLRDVNVDHNAVGWYTSTYLSSFLNDNTIETQFNYQAQIGGNNTKPCVVLVFDPLKTSQGLLSLRAYRLTQQFFQLYQAHSFTKESLEAANMTYEDIFEQIPIKIHNSGLINALLYDMQDSDQVSAHFERLNLSINPFLEKNLEFLTESLDELSAEQNKIQKANQRQQAYLSKKKADGEEDDSSQFHKTPSRLESLLITNQINKYCEQINTFAGTSFAKLFLYGGMQKQEGNKN